MRYRRIIEFRGLPPYDDVLCLPCVKAVMLSLRMGEWTAEMTVTIDGETVKAYPGDLLCENDLGSWSVLRGPQLKWEMLKEKNN